MVKSHDVSRITIIALFLTIFVDAAGMALVYPVLTPLFIHNQTHLFSVDISSNIRSYIYGFVLAIYPIMMFFGSPFLGELSDKYGRKLILLICVFGNFIGLVIMGIGVNINSLGIIIFARIFTGITAANLPIAQAAIIDISDAQTKAKNISIITSANSVGFIVGPVISMIFSLPFFAKYFNLATPFYVASILSLITLYLIKSYFFDSYKGNKNLNLNVFRSIKSIHTAFKLKDTKLPLYILTFFLVGYYIYFNYLTMFSLLKFNYNQLMESVLLGYFAVFFAISLIFIIPFLTKVMSLEKCLLLSIIPQFVSMIILVGIKHSITLWVISAIMALFVPCTYVVLLSILSNKSAKEFQGRIMGVSSSVNSFSWGIAPLISAMLQPKLVILPIIASSIILFIAFLLIINFIYNKK